MSFVCPKCGLESHHPEDEAAGYCGFCHEFTGRDDMTFVGHELTPVVQRPGLDAAAEAAYYVAMATDHPGEDVIPWGELARWKQEMWRREVEDL